jgi:1,4-dihydroxy-2-naphthoate polyprenyltransferase
MFKKVKVIKFYPKKLFSLRKRKLQQISLMLQASTLQLLRLKFSFFLMPVYWFALSQVENINMQHAVLIFVILHLLVYPASNGYNSYMDRDTESIGGIKNPLPATKELFNVTIVMDVLAVVISAYISIYCTLSVVGFIAASRAYSYRGIRLKRYPIIGFIVTSVFQGAVVFFLVNHGSSIAKSINVPALPMIASAFLIGSFYPLTQIYQHQQDKADGVKTLSMLLGLNGTFIFTGLSFFVAMNCLAAYFFLQLEQVLFFTIALFTLPTLVYFFWWMLKVRKDKTQANFENTMRMNIIASICTNAAFIAVLLIEKL